MSTGKSELVLNTDGLTAEGTAPPALGADGKPVVPVAPERTYGGFKTVEELEAAYAAGTPPVVPVVDDKAPKGPLEIEDGGDEGDDDGVADALAKAGLSHDDFNKEFAAEGKLSEDSYGKLAKAGYPKAMVDVYVRGLQAEQAAYTAAIYGPVKDEAGYTSLLTWAKTGATAAEKTAFNEAVTSGDPARASMAVTAMASKMAGKGGLLNGKTTVPGDGVQPFASNTEMVTAMRDPRYRKDPAYRKGVENRLRVSPAF